jgi:outer membrane immunogenic protein
MSVIDPLRTSGRSKISPSLCLSGNSPPAGRMVGFVCFGAVHMKKLLTVIAVAGLIGTPVFAADMAVKAPPPPPPAPVYSWTGFYVGVNAGGAWGHSSFSTDPGCNRVAATGSVFCNTGAFAPNGPVVAAAGSGSFSPASFTGGAQVGYNWQAGYIVYGLEGDFEYLHLKASSTVGGLYPVPFLGNRFVVNDAINTNWLATIRGRLGYTYGPNLLLFATGGAAFSDFKVTSSYSDNAVGGGFPGGFGFGVSSAVKTGWTVGGGAEWIFAPQWSVKVEYLYVDLGNKSINVQLNNTDVPTDVHAQLMIVNANLTTNIVRVGLNHQFH